MDIGQYGNTDLLSHFTENLQAFGNPSAAKRLDRAAIGLVKRRLEDKRHSIFCGDLLQLGRHEQHVIPAFNDTRARDQKEFLLEIELEIRKRVAHFRFAAYRSVFARASLCS